MTYFQSVRSSDLDIQIFVLRPELALVMDIIQQMVGSVNSNCIGDTVSWVAYSWLYFYCDGAKCITDAMARS